MAKDAVIVLGAHTNVILSMDIGLMSQIHVLVLIPLSDVFVSDIQKHVMLQCKSPS